MSSSTAATPFSLSRHRPFLFFWFARVFTASGSQMHSVAIAWQIYELTHSAWNLGIVGLMQFLPRIALMAHAGNAADRYDRKTVVLISQLVQASALLLLSIASAGHFVTQELIYVLVIVTGAARSFEMPTTQALIPGLVPETTLPRAVAMSASAMQAATILAPALAGVLYVLGPTTVYGLTAALFFGAAGLTAGIEPMRTSLRAPNGSAWASFVEGVRFIRAHPLILGTISLDLFAVLLGGATALLPIIAHDVLHTGPWGLGLLRSAPAIGALAMSIWLAHHPLRHSVGKRMFAAVAVFGLATIAFGLSRSLLLSMLALIVLGASDMVSVVIRAALVQMRTPDAMRGRVSAVNSVFIGASNQLGEFESGVTAAWLGTVPAVVAGGLGTLLVVVLWKRLFPQLAKAETLAH